MVIGCAVAHQRAAATHAAHGALSRVSICIIDIALRLKASWHQRFFYHVI